MYNFKIVHFFLTGLMWGRTFINKSNTWNPWILILKKHWWLWSMQIWCICKLISTRIFSLLPGTIVKLLWNGCEIHQRNWSSPLKSWRKTQRITTRGSTGQTLGDLFIQDHVVTYCNWINNQSLKNGYKKDQRPIRIWKKYIFRKRRSLFCFSWARWTWTVN